MGICKTKDASLFRIADSLNQSISVQFGAGKVFEYKIMQNCVKLNCKHIEIIIPVQEFEKYFSIVEH